MATKTWIGGTSTDVNTAANWSGAAVPGAGDDCIWNSTTTYAPASGTFANNLTSFTATDLAASTTAGQGLGDASGSCTFLNVTTMRLGNRAVANYILSSGTIGALKLEMPNGGAAFLTGGTFTTVDATDVPVTVGASAIVTTGRSVGSSAWVVATNGTAITTWTGSGSVETTSRNITTWNGDGTGARLVTKGTAATTTSNAVNGAVHISQSSADQGTVNLRGTGSKFSVAGNPNPTVTTTTVNVWKGGILEKVVPGCTMTVTNENVVGSSIGPVS